MALGTAVPGRRLPPFSTLTGPPCSVTTGHSGARAPDDARLVVDAGADAVVVSNHGDRQAPERKRTFGNPFMREC
ncbi:alpha-hydroxy-acid oxidizing protein [Nocardia amikacinitolerans]|uniref:alpha-hydroxy-acid oxidizing protein n=1 Tax=Nocardia amikacinitolerans TaxID=756689 RepID=UPI0035571296